jgi:hypothetical protein
LWVTRSAPDEKIHKDTEIASQLGEEIEKAVRPYLYLFVGQLETHIKIAIANIKSMNGWLSFIGI